MTRRACRAAAFGSAHRFGCPDCRVDARLDAAWKALPARLPVEAPQAAGEPFVARVLAAARRDRERARARTVWLAAAAALIFSFFAGLGQERTAADTATPGPEEAYAALASPNPLGGLIPN